MAKKQNKKETKEKFEDLLKKAEDVVGDLERGDIDLADAIAKYQEGLTALKKCYEVLKAVEGKVQVLRSDDDGNVTLEPFKAHRSGE